MNYIINSFAEGWQAVAESWRAFVECWPLKWALGVVAYIMSYLIHTKHVQVFGLFVLLVIIDLVTKWAAIAYQMLIDRGAKPENVYIIDKYMAIPVAFGAGLIGSRYWRKGFKNKLMQYGSATIVAYVVDCIITRSGYPAFLLNFTWLYLAGSEFLSILENMRDGGNVLMGKLLDLAREQIQKRLGIKL